MYFQFLWGIIESFACIFFWLKGVKRRFILAFIHSSTTIFILFHFLSPLLSFSSGLFPLHFSPNLFPCHSPTRMWLGFCPHVYSFISLSFSLLTPILHLCLLNALLTSSLCCPMLRLSVCLSEYSAYFFLVFCFLSVLSPPTFIFLSYFRIVQLFFNHSFVEQVSCLLPFLGALILFRLSS